MAKTKFKSNPSAVIRFLANIMLCLSTVNIFIQFAIYSFGLKKEWFLLFNMDKEVNIPTLFSILLLITSAYLIYLINKKSKNINDKIRNKWNTLKWIFIFLSFDEGLQIHEILIIPKIKPMLPPIFTNVWVIPYGIFSLIALVYFIPLIKSLPFRVRNSCLLAGTTYISGALGFEMIGSFLVRTGDIKLHGISYGLISTIEESLEMTGLIIFIYALLIYLLDYQRKKLKINLRLASKEFNSEVE